MTAFLLDLYFARSGEAAPPHRHRPDRHRPVHRHLRGAAVRADPEPHAEGADVTRVRGAEHPEFRVHRRRGPAVAGRAQAAALDHSAAVPGTGHCQRAGGDLHLHHRPRIPDALPQLGDGAHPVPVAPARHRGQCARRRRRAAGLQPCQLHGRADPVGDDPAPGALRHVLQDLQHPGDALDLPHRQGDPDRRCARRPGIDAARVRRDRCRAG
ncbi:hypothetical protein G6F22_016474 [Rhizopus arrhizus]|nr:hypothetical protein G6F22_016474 [Rhizopus arrhizus]KAG0934065.1 hypothetical protein G6F31_016178 [Rhizopus arrhizus]